MMRAILKDTGRSLLERCRRGDLDAWERLLREYYDDVSRFLFQLDPRLTPEAARDLTGEVFDRAVNTIEKALDEHVSPRVWLLRLAAERIRAVQENGSTSFSMDCSDSTQLRGLLDRVGGPCRDILELAYFGGLETKELAAALDIEPATVDPRINMCLNRLELFLQQDASGEFTALHQE